MWTKNVLFSWRNLWFDFSLQRFFSKIENFDFGIFVWFWEKFLIFQKNLQTKFQTKISPRKKIFFFSNFLSIKIYIEIYPLQLTRGEAAKNHLNARSLKSKIPDIPWNIKSNLVLLYQVSYVPFWSFPVKQHEFKLNS